MSFIRLTKEEAKEKIAELVKNFNDNRDVYMSTMYKETSVRDDFIDKFFMALGWDVNDDNALAINREVIKEDNQKQDQSVKHPDYSFRYNKEVKFFVEAKKPSEQLKSNPSHAKQIRKYGYTKKLQVSILTDFEEFIVYNTTKKPKENDSANTAKLYSLNYNQYIEHFDEIYDRFSWEAVCSNGGFEKYIKNMKLKGNEEVDSDLLETIETWRESLAKSISLRNDNSITKEQLNIAVQRIIDRLLFLRIAEDREIEYNNYILSVVDNNNDVYKELVKIFEEANKKYNSGIFKSEKWLNNLSIDNDVLENIVKDMYPPKCFYQWNVLPIEILGNIYEQFLGSEIIFKGVKNGNRTAKIEKKPEVKKAGGVYYTPKYIVDYIIENTVGIKLKKLTIKEVDKLKILDLSCGSGSFLIGAYKYLLDWYFSQYTKSETVKMKYINNNKLVNTDRGLQLSIEEKKRILNNNIYGVDIDEQAVEVTKLSLFLQLLDNQGRRTKNGQTSVLMDSENTILPNLSSNIKCGNSIVNSSIYNDFDKNFDEEDRLKINAFNWENGYSKIIDEGGFDIIVGNPPYIDSEAMTLLMPEQRNFCSTEFKCASGNWDIYICFMEKSISLLNNHGMMMFITPDKWITKPFGQEFRKNFKDLVYQIVKCGRGVFKDASIDSIITGFSKNKTKNVDVKIWDKETKNFVFFQKYVKTAIKKPYQFDMFFSKYTDILNKLDSINGKMEDHFSCDNACATEAVYKLEKIIKSLKSSEQYSKDKHYKIINTGTIGPFKDKWGIKPIRYQFKDYLCPVANIKEFDELFPNSYGIKTKKKKVIIKGLTLLDCCIDFEGKIIPGKQTLIIPANNDNDLKLICALVNSKISSFYIKEKYSSYSYNGGVSFQYSMINSLPWIELEQKDKDEIIKYVDNILRVLDKEQKDDKRIIDFRDAIDSIYYKYFDLTAEEKSIINNYK